MTTGPNPFSEIESQIWLGGVAMAIERQHEKGRLTSPGTTGRTKRGLGTLDRGTTRRNRPGFVSPGLHYLVSHDLEVGFRLGWGLNDQSARFFSNVGVGYRY